MSLIASGESSKSAHASWSVSCCGRVRRHGQKAGLINADAAAGKVEKRPRQFPVIDRRTISRTVAEHKLLPGAGNGDASASGTGDGNGRFGIGHQPR